MGMGEGRGGGGGRCRWFKVCHSAAVTEGERRLTADGSPLFPPCPARDAHAFFYLPPRREASANILQQPCPHVMRSRSSWHRSTAMRSAACVAPRPAPQSPRRPLLPAPVFARECPRRQRRRGVTCRRAIRSARNSRPHCRAREGGMPPATRAGAIPRSFMLSEAAGHG